MHSYQREKCSKCKTNIAVAFNFVRWLYIKKQGSNSSDTACDGESTKQLLDMKTTFTTEVTYPIRLEATFVLSKVRDSVSKNI